VTAAAIVGWVELFALAGVVGALAVGVLVLPADAHDLAGAHHRLRRWTLAAVAVLALGTMAALVVRAETMSQAGFVDAIRFAPAVLGRTHFGTIWIARGAGLAMLLVLACAASRAARVAALLLAVGLVATTALTGHAADWGDFRLAVLVDWIHVVAAAAWAGGLFALAAVVVAASETWSPDTLRRVTQRFSALAGWCLLALVASGVHNTVIQVGAVSAFWSTAYGRVLAIKLLVFIVLVWLGAVNRYLVLPSLTGDGGGGRIAGLIRLTALTLPRASDAAVSFARYVGREAMLALVVFGCTAVLGELTPGRHAIHLFSQEHHEEGHQDHLTALERDNALSRRLLLRSAPGAVVP